MDQMPQQMLPFKHSAVGGVDRLAPPLSATARVHVSTFVSPHIANRDNGFGHHGRKLGLRWTRSDSTKLLQSRVQLSELSAIHWTLACQS